jgi:hypothetical protein
MNSITDQPNNQETMTLVDKFVHIIQMYELVSDVILEIAYYYVTLLRKDNEPQDLRLEAPELVGTYCYA